MTDINDIINAFSALSENENETMFAQGILLAGAVAAGFKAADVKRECGIATGKTARTMANRLLVGTVWGNDWLKDHDWSLHLATCQLAHVDLAKPDTYKAAHDLMDLALKGDEQGRILTAKTLKEKIAGNPARPKATETVYSGQAVVSSINGNPRGVYVTFIIPVKDFPPDLRIVTDTYGLTITRSLPQSATVDSVGEKAVA